MDMGNTTSKYRPVLEGAEQIDQLELQEALAKSPFAEQIPAFLREAHAMFYQKPKKRLSQSW